MEYIKTIPLVDFFEELEFVPPIATITFYDGLTSNGSLHSTTSS